MAKTYEGKKKRKYTSMQKLEYLLGAWDSGAAGRKLARVNTKSESYLAGNEAARRAYDKARRRHA